LRALSAGANIEIQGRERRGWPVGRKRCTSFSRAAAEGHLRARHGRCPPELLERFIDTLATREWVQPVTIGQAFGLVAQAHVRHAMTDYDRVLRVPGITREEARLIIKGEVAAIIASWATPAEERRAMATQARQVATHSPRCS
jgi:hypothetical protein